MKHHIYQETIKIESNKAGRILRHCEVKGMELYDLFANNLSVPSGTIRKSTKKQEKTYYTQYIEWTEFTKSKLKDIFLTPRIYLEFEKKDSTKENQTIEQVDLMTHIDRGLVNQIYFLKSIINEVDSYYYAGRTPISKNDGSKSLVKEL